MDFSSFSYFNPRLREGGDNSTRLSINSCFVFQSTPPRRRRLFHLVNLLLYKEISIHASEKEATTAYDIHTQLFSFQSTPPRRRRRGVVEKTFRPTDISIHASEKEATATYCDTSTIMYISSLNNFFVRYF